MARVAQTLFGRLLRTGGLDPGSLLDLGQASDILTLSVNEKIPNAAHIPIVEKGCPHLSGENQPHFVFWKTPEVEIVIQVQDLTFTRGCVGSTESVDRDGT